MSLRSWFICSLFGIAVLCWSNSVHIHLKARLAQSLISGSWAATSATQNSLPWFWADTWPVARMRYKGNEWIVLSGGHGSALAFGPGQVDGTSAPGMPGVSIVAGHRDTHFAVLETMKVGDTITVQRRDRRWNAWQIESISVEDTRQSAGLLYDSSQDLLILVTCYPFDALEAGGPLRYVVRAEPLPWGQAPVIATDAHLASAGS